MRIDLGYSANVSTQVDRGSKPAASSLSGAKDEIGADEARLSVDQVTVKSLEEELSQLPDIRKDKVDDLRQQILEGTYNVNPDQVAAAMYRDLIGFRFGD